VEEANRIRESGLSIKVFLRQFVEVVNLFLAVFEFVCKQLKALKLTAGCVRGRSGYPF
jgi:hypothetical protein